MNRIFDHIIRAVPPMRRTCRCSRGYANAASGRPLYRKLTRSNQSSGGERKPAAPRRGATVAERLACSPPTKANRVQSPAGSPDFRKWESCRTMPLVGGFSSEIFRFPRPSIPALHHSHFNHPHRLSRPRYIMCGEFIATRLGVQINTVTPLIYDLIEEKYDLAVSIAENNRNSADVVESSFTGVEPRNSSPAHHVQHLQVVLSELVLCGPEQRRWVQNWNLARIRSQ
ncbi:hypothetical protein PR048_000702 [Dryococelus australis]|uniref:Uncharacterized protein n=1 Tax=Dryococelus australis TaxID=614101 RepID=A0ABQ9IFC5_9NEOP|nr:hypothetical protein PR048_000702 [Dryococelus australis]